MGKIIGLVVNEPKRETPEKVKSEKPNKETPKKEG